MKKSSTRDGMHPYLRPGFVNPVKEQKRGLSIPLLSEKELKEITKR